MVENGCHLNPVWKIFLLGGPGKFIASICDPFKNTVLIFKGTLSHNVSHFPVGFKRHMKPSFFHVPAT